MRKTIPTLGVVSAGLLLAGSPAHAQDVDMTTAVNVGIANGIQANLPIQVPVNFCGNAIGLLGNATAGCVGDAKANYATGGHKGGGYNNNGGGGGGGNSDLLSLINVGIANGIQADALVQVPVNICGNAIGLLGNATASCVDSGATANAFTGGGGDNTFTGGRDNTFIGGGDHGRPPGHYPYGHTPRKPAPAALVSKPMPGKVVAGKVVAGKPRATAPRKKAEAGLLANLLAPVTGLLGGGERNNGGWGGGGGGDKKCGDVHMTSLGNVGIANGIQAHAPIQIPVNFSGNAIAIGGNATASSVGGAAANYC